jgi:hypothetical protein
MSRVNIARAMLVAFVERVIGAFDEDFAPLNERGGQEPRDHTNQDFLDEGRLHFTLMKSKSDTTGAGFTKSPIVLSA